MTELTDLTFNYHSLESRTKRDANQEIFEQFLDCCGSKLTKLELKIPFQRSDFFNSVQTKCPKLKHTVIKVRGTPTFFDGTEFTNVPKLRKVHLDLTIRKSQLRNLLNTCDKLRKLRFNNVEHDPEYVKLQLKPLIIEYSNKHPRRLMDVYVRLQGEDCYRHHDDTIDGMLRMKIEKGYGNFPWLD